METWDFGTKVHFLNQLDPASLLRFCTTNTFWLKFCTDPATKQYLLQQQPDLLSDLYFLLDQNLVLDDHTIEFLLGMGIDLEEIILSAVESRQKDPLQYLLKRGYRVRNCYESLFIAIKEDDPSTLQLLLELGCDPNSTNDLGMTPLHQTFIYDRLNLAEMLLENGANPNIKDVFMKTPLHQATFHGKIDFIKLLLKYGADPNLKDNNENVPLFYAVANKRLDIAKILLEYGADPNVENLYGISPFIHSLYGSDRAMVDLLLAYGADPDRLDRYGNTPRSIYYRVHGLPLIP